MRARPRRTCHYCGERATTRDHVVPRAHVRVRVTDGAPPNTVPACYACNQAKGQRRSPCACEVCETAWRRYGPEYDVEVTRWLDDVVLP